MEEPQQEQKQQELTQVTQGTQVVPTQVTRKWTTEDLKQAVQNLNWTGMHAVGTQIRINGAYAAKVNVKSDGNMTLDEFIEFAKQEYHEIRKDMPRKQQSKQSNKKPRLSTLESEAECSTVESEEMDSKAVLLIKLLESFNAKKRLDPDKFVALCFNYQEACKKMESEQKLLFDYVLSRL